LAETNYHLYTEISKPLFDKLTTLITGNAEIDSMLRYAATWFFIIYPNDHELEKLLLESINLCQSHVNNYKTLAELYMRQEKYSEAKKLLQKAMKNVVKIRTKNPSMTDVQHFLAEYIKGTYSTSFLEGLAIEASIRAKEAQDPLNIGLLLQLSLVEAKKFGVTHEKATASIQKILSYDPDNVIALIIWAYKEYISKNLTDKSLLKKLTMIKTNDAEINSMLLYVASWFYANKDDNKQKELLLQSINEYPGHVCNYDELATLYSKQGKNEEARKLWKKALDNIKVYSNSDSIDYITEVPSQDGTEYIVDVNEFLNTVIKGTHSLASIVEDLKKKAEVN
jgi:tetratricopeptide (TPR) repeat protein